MFTNSLSQNAADTLALLGKSNILDGAYLAGGTACALHLGHRFSFDLDFFTNKEFPTKVIVKQLGKLANNIYHILRSLSYFTDADRQDPPEMIEHISWEKVKEFFRSEVVRLSKQFLGR